MRQSTKTTFIAPGASVLGIIRRHRALTGSFWRKLNPGQQALLVLAYLRKGETFAGLAAGFGVGTSTAWRYVQETVALLAARAPKLGQAAREATKAGYPYVVQNGTRASGSNGTMSHGKEPSGAGLLGPRAAGEEAGADAETTEEG